ncbi:uncharacterized protein BYT42DRAFT_488449, partial [Radiomyces spectabilis]|uniref:uncharacterized protein n=1 Tax=Radiomyces spectabilis TaxID=64574 RepID=UPI00221EAC4D
MTNIPLPKAEAERPSYNLEALVEQYGSSPDLLQLILSSKVEEDKRRAEEAKLRSKEIDYMLKWRPSSPHPGFAS